MMLQSAENTSGISYRINGDNKRYRVPTIERPMGNRLCCDTCNQPRQGQAQLPHDVRAEAVERAGARTAAVHALYA